ncbi:MAG: hypothetical protein ABIT05_16315 [Chitinophagaceae bacterium]
MTEEFLVFRQFPDKEAAEDFAEELVKAGIDHRVDSVGTLLDSNYIGGAANRTFSIKMASADFEKANDALGDYYKKVIGTIDKDYYLFSFSDSELFEIIAKRDEWGPLDYQLALQILIDRGRPIDTVTINRLKENRLGELAQPEKDDWAMLTMGYLLTAASILSLFLKVGFALSPYGFVLSLLTGSLLAYNKKVLPNGSRVYSYASESRKHGKIIVVTAVIVLCISVVNWLIFMHDE